MCNTGKTVDLRVQCLLNIQGYEVRLLLDTGATSSTVDRNFIQTLVPNHLIKYTNELILSIQFDGKHLACHHFIKNSHIKFYTNIIVENIAHPLVFPIYGLAL